MTPGACQIFADVSTSGSSGESGLADRSHSSSSIFAQRRQEEASMRDRDTVSGAVQSERTGAEELWAAAWQSLEPQPATAAGETMSKAASRPGAWWQLPGFPSRRSSSLETRDRQVSCPSLCSFNLQLLTGNRVLGIAAAASVLGEKARVSSLRQHGGWHAGSTAACSSRGGRCQVRSRKTRCCARICRCRALRPVPRKQLLACALAALERQIAAAASQASAR